MSAATSTSSEADSDYFRERQYKKNYETLRKQVEIIKSLDDYDNIHDRVILNKTIDDLRVNPDKWATEIKELTNIKKNLPRLRYSNIDDFLKEQQYNDEHATIRILGNPEEDKEDAELYLGESIHIEWKDVQKDLANYGVDLVVDPYEKTTSDETPIVNDSSEKTTSKKTTSDETPIVDWASQAYEEEEQIYDFNGEESTKFRYPKFFDKKGAFIDGFKERIALQMIANQKIDPSDRGEYAQFEEMKQYMTSLQEELGKRDANFKDLAQQGKIINDKKTGKKSIMVELPYVGGITIPLETLDKYGIMNGDKENGKWVEEEAAASAPVEEAAASAPVEAVASASDTQYKTSASDTRHGTSAPEKDTRHYHIPIELKDIVNQIKYCDKLKRAKNDIEYLRDTNKFTELDNAKEEAAGYAKLTEDTFYIRHSDLKSLFGVEKKINAKYTYNTNRLRGIMSIDYEATSKEIEEAFAKYNIKIVPDETAPRSYRDTTDDSILNPFANSSQRTRQPGNTDNLGFEEAYNIVEGSANGWRKLREIEAQSTRRKKPIPYEYAVIQEAKKILDRSNPSDEPYKPTRKQLKDEAESRKRLDDAQREASEAQETRDEEQRKALSEQGSVLRPDRVKPAMPINISNMPKESTWSNLVKSTGTGTGTGIGTGTGKSKKSDIDQGTYDTKPNERRRRGSFHKPESDRDSKATINARATLFKTISKGMSEKDALYAVAAHENFRDNRNRRGPSDDRENYSEEHEVFCVRSIGRKVLNKKKRMRRMTPLIKSLKKSLKLPSKKSLKRPSKKHSKKSTKKKHSKKLTKKKHSKKSTKKKHSKKSSKKKALKKYRFSV